MSSRCCTDASIRNCAFYTLLPRRRLRSHAGSRQQSSQQVLLGLLDTSFGGRFYVLPGHDVVGDVHASLQRSFSQRHGASFDERRGAMEQTAKHASKPVSTLHTRTDELGQCASRLLRVIVVVTNFFRTDRSCDDENEASPSPYRVGRFDRG